MLQNIIFRDYDKLKSKQKKFERTHSYDVQFSLMLAQIVRIDNIEEITGLDIDVLSHVKLTEGVVGIINKNDNYYMVTSIVMAGMPRKDGRPYQVTGSWIDDNQKVHVDTFTNDVDIVLWYNNALMQPETNIEYFSYMFTEVDTSLHSNVAFSRLNPFLKAKNDIQKKQYEEALKQSHDGELKIIVDGEKSVFSSVEDAIINVNDVKDASYIQYLSHLHDDLLKRFCNLYGVSMNQTSKQAQQSVQEVQGMESASWLLCIDFLNQAKEFCERLKALYNIEVTAHFGMVHELNFNKFIALCTKDVDMDSDNCDEESQEDDEESQDDDNGGNEDDSNS